MTVEAHLAAGLSSTPHALMLTTLTDVGIKLR
jgi:hypothetical protein